MARELPHPDRHGERLGREPTWRDVDLDRLHLIQTLVDAIERHAEVSDTIVSSKTEESAKDAVAQMLGVCDMCATEVMNMQWRRLSREGLADLRRRAAEIQARLRSADADG